MNKEQIMEAIKAALEEFTGNIVTDEDELFKLIADKIDYQELRCS
jgi:hypothetical protein